MKLTKKQQQKDEAFISFGAIVKPAREARDAMLDLADKERNAMEDLAWESFKAIVIPERESYLAKIKEIDEQKEEV